MKNQEKRASSLSFASAFALTKIMLKIAWTPAYAHPLPEGHRFPMMKYELIPQQLLRLGVIQPENLFEPKPASRELLELTHHQAYLNELELLSLDKAHIRRIGFPLSKELVDREYRITQGTVDCSLYALEFGLSMNIAGGTHHAFANRGEGFCLLNDMAVAANFLLNKKLAKQVLIIDLDVHQGNGTASLFANEPRVFTFSMHGKNNFPFHKEKSDLDCELPDGMEDEAYLKVLKDSLEKITQQIKPDFIYYLCGVDVLETDKLGKLKLSLDACAKRDELVFEFAKAKKCPVVCAMGGGYSEKLSVIVDAHCKTFEKASEIFF